MEILVHWPAGQVEGNVADGNQPVLFTLHSLFSHGILKASDDFQSLWAAANNVYFII